ncbi:MAG: hypothetical protein ACI9R3_003442 [Verrucomicrobiales bacterium]|jgi:hypothetical protein
MKQTRKTTNTSAFKKQDEKGVAIITVLSVLMLMTVMVISFFTMATNELSASRSTAEGLRAVSAKDVAINLAIAQIREATTREGTTWISQPGAIRVYGSRTRTGRASSIYKLYSASSMIGGSMTDIRKDLAGDWNQNPEQYVDLNRPVISPDPTDPENVARADIHFPIVDPRAFKGEGQVGSIEGFSYQTAAIPGIVGGGADYLKRLPMPVQWLYILADGSVGYLDKGNRFVGSIQPTEENPMTSRIAFWTDDESCKVNVNTASEGVYWDTPRVDTDQDRELATNQPATGEYQRYPGHPAQTCLSTVLFPNEGKLEGGRLDPERDISKFEALWTIAPGIGTGGSKGGTEKTKEIDGEGISAVPEEFHLYTSPDEILFRSDLRGGQRMVHQQITKEKLETAKFFLTARSRSPEATMLGYPRVSMWPLSNNARQQTPFDKVIAFCSTIKRQEYFFQRQDAYSRHWEFYINSGAQNERLYESLKTLTSDPIPGYGSSFGAKYGEGRFDDRDNLLAETLDYFRGTNIYDPSNKQANQYTRGNGKNFDKTVGHGQISGICLCGGSSDHGARWHNARLPLPKGFGRMFGISEIAFVLVLRAEWTPQTLNDDGTEATPAVFIGDERDKDEYEMADGEQLIQMGFLVEGFAPAHGWTSLQPLGGISLGSGTGNRDDDIPASITLGGVPLERVKRDREIAWATKYSSRRPEHWIAWGGYGGVRMFDNFISFEPIKSSTTQKEITFSGSEGRGEPLRIILYENTFDYNEGAPQTGSLIQSYQFAFPKVTMPKPTWWNPIKPGKKEWYSFRDRMTKASSEGVEGFLFHETHDVVKSLVPSHGDYRLTTSKRVVEPESFVPHPEYSKANNNMAHSLTDYTNESDNGVRLLPGGTFGKSFLGLDYAEGTEPDFPIGPDNSDQWANDVGRDGREREPYDPEITGDFDQGVGNAPDGPYINRPDDGDTRGLPSGDPYFDENREVRQTASATFSPNRVIPSPGMLGSLSTGVQSNVPWQTLLFRPAIEKNHFGARGGIPDHVWMDYFWMPVVQPYVISEPFSTAGKVNLNYQIVPFTYIKRATGLHAVMKAEKMLAIPNNQSKKYKTNGGNAEWRHFIDIEETLEQWEKKFEDGDTFRSASEVCEMYLVPEGEKWRSESAMENYWSNHKLTGDNSKERPYTNMYPRLTVRSNTFKVHLVAQSLIKVKGTEVTTFDTLRDRVAGEYRGSAIIERSISPSDPDLPNYTGELSKGSKPESLDLFYTYRIVNEKRFAP